MKAPEPFPLISPEIEVVPVLPLETVTGLVQKREAAFNDVKLPVEGVVAPTGVPSIEPPVIAAPEEANELAVTRPVPNVTGSFVTGFIESMPEVESMTGVEDEREMLAPNVVSPETFRAPPRRALP